METFLSEFILETSKCECFEEKIFSNTTNKLENNLKCTQNVNHILKLGYQSGAGLKLIGSSNKNNPLGEFLSIKKNDLTSVKSFVEKYGYLYRKEESVFDVEIQSILLSKEKLLAFITLVNFQSRKELDNFQLFLDSILYLIFRRKVLFYELIDTTLLLDRDNKFLRYRQEGSQTVAYYEINDYILNEQYLLSQENVDSLQKENNFLKTISTLHILKDNFIENHDEKVFIDFLYHFFTEYSYFTEYDISIDEPIFPSELYSDLYKDEKMLSSLISISKQLILEIFSSELSSVQPVYDVEHMKPSWKLPDLLSALYFSIYYKNTNCLYRKCENINCSQFFEVSKTNHSKKYCCIACKNSTNQRMYQEKKNKGL